MARRWLRQREDPQQAFPGRVPVKREQREIKPLRREVAQLTAERDIQCGIICSPRAPLGGLHRVERLMRGQALHARPRRRGVPA
jgi:transposase-like protein